MTATTRIEDRLTAEEFSALLNAAADAIIVINSAGRIEKFNPAAEHLFGYSPEQTIGKNVNMLMPDPYHSEHDSYLKNHLDTNINRIIGRGREVVGLHADGSEFPVDLSVGRVESQDEIRFVGILRDLTHQRENEAEIAKQRQELSRISRQATAGELAAALAHELNQPLSAIATYSGAAQRFLQKIQVTETDHDTLDQTKTALEEIQKQSLRAGEVIQRMRAFVQSDDTKRDRVPVGDLLDEILPIAQLDARSEGVVFNTQLQGKERILNVDKIQIQQVLLNLVRNAVDATGEKHSGSQRAVHISTILVNDHQIEFSVQDNGPGIPEDFVEDLFTPFKSTKTNGLGMGLAISNSIIESHGDKLHFSTGPDGCNFYFTLPAN